MQPVKNNILVKPYPPEEFTKGGIFVPESAREVNNKVLVVKVGNGTVKRPMKFKPGQTGYRVQNWGTEVMIDNELHYLMDMSAILATE